MIKAQLVARTFETRNSAKSILVGDMDFDINLDAKLLAGKAAGICYMPDDYLSEGINDTEKCLKRADLTAKNGHYSTWEHMSVSILFTNIPKIMSMTLNNLKYYAASEKSARYTKMEDTHPLCNNKYNKWLNKFKKLIDVSYGDILSEKEIEKKAQENARYMLSVFTPTTELYTVPYGRLMMLISYLSITANKFEDMRLFSNSSFKTNYAKACNELVDAICEALKIDRNNLPLYDKKFIKIPLFLPNNYSKTLEKTPMIKKDDYFGDTYTYTYEGSFAQLAQAQRHRTLDYTISEIRDVDTILPKFYIPKILNSKLSDEWIADLKEIYKENIIPQAYMINITEQGTVENFVLKCTERLCNQAQLEIALQTSETLMKYYSLTKSDYAKQYLKMWVRVDIRDNDMINGVRRRCDCTYNCTNPDTLCKYKISFNDNTKDI